MKQITINAPAKLNFGLQVLNKREDGYHNINTVFFKINIFDVLKFSLSDNTEIIMKPDVSIPYEENIVYKTLLKLSEKYHNKAIMNLKVELTKTIPMGAGMGGGSTDAAATIKAVNSIFSLEKNLSDFNELAKSIGADVPYFLNEGDAVGKGIGEKLEYFNFELPFYILIVFPNLHISTPNAYKALQRSDQYIAETDFKQLIEKFIDDKIVIKKFVYNDFEVPAFDMHKDLRDIKEDLYEFGADFALMTGSGSAFFGLFSDFDKAVKAENHFNDFKTFITRKI